MLKKFTSSVALLGLTVTTLVGGKSADACDKYVRVAPARPVAVYYRPAVVEIQAAKSQVVAEVAATTIKVEVPLLESGTTLTVYGKYFGSSSGEAVVQVGRLKIPCTIESWQNDRVTLTLPELEIDEPLHSELQVVLPTGAMAKSMAFRWEGKPDFVVNSVSRGMVASTQAVGEQSNR